MISNPKKSRRVRKYWTEEETELLIKSVNKHGCGHWSAIMKAEPKFYTNGRTQVDLKDKWRNLTRKDIIPKKSVRRSRSPLRRSGGKSPRYEFEIYTLEGCNYCIEVKNMLRKANKTFREIKVNKTNQDRIYNKLDTKTKKYRYFPMIFRNSKFIGGFTELQKIKL